MSEPFVPKPQQPIMLDYMLENPIAMLSVGMGLCKTSSVLWAISHMISSGMIRSALIVAPKRVITMTWPAEREKWNEFGWMKMVSLRTPEGLDAWNRGTADIYLINYDMLQKFVVTHLAKRKTLPVDMVVYDEITKLKSASSRRAKAILPFRKMFSRIVGLTGTLGSQGYMDLFGPYRMLDGGERLGAHITHFRDRYFESDYMGYTYTLKDWAKPVIEAKISDITLTMTTEEWLNIPDTIYEDIGIDLPADLRKKYRELEKELLLTIRHEGTDREIVAPNAAVLSGKLLQFLSGCIYDENKAQVPVHDLKIKALQALMAKVKRPILLAVAFVHEKDRIVKAIKGAEIFDEKRLDVWNAKEIPLWVVHPGSAGHGLNLQDGGDVVCWFSQTHSQDMSAQMNARLVRTGQKNVTTIYRLLINDSYDDVIVETLRNRDGEQAGLLNALKNLKRMRDSQK